MLLSKYFSTMFGKYFSTTNGIDLDTPENSSLTSECTKLDVFFFFRHILGRLPTGGEWDSHCNTFVGKQLENSLSTYISSPEFLMRDLVNYTLADSELVDLPDGYKIYASPSDPHVGSHVVTAKMYEPNVSQIFRSNLSSGMNVLDIGANIGWFTFLSRHLVGPSGKVTAIEAGPANIQMLLKSNKINAWQDNVEIIFGAASDSFETLVYSAVGSNGMVNSLSDIPDPLAGNPVMSFPIEKIVDDNTRWDFVKIDIEGFEWKAISGMQSIIERDHPKFVIEFCPEAIQNNSDIAAEEFLSYFVKLGYSLSVIGDNKLIDFEKNSDSLLKYYQSSGREHLDLFLKV